MDNTFWSTSKNNLKINDKIYDTRYDPIYDKNCNCLRRYLRNWFSIGLSLFQWALQNNSNRFKQTAITWCWSTGNTTN